MTRTEVEKNDGLNVIPGISRVVRHILFWIAILGFFSLFGYLRSTGSFLRVVLNNLVFLPQDITLTYIILYLIIPRLYTKRRYTLFVLSILIVLGANVSLSFLLNATVVPLIGGYEGSDTIASRIYYSILVFTFIASIAVVLHLIGLNSTIQLKKEIAESRYRKAELALLRSQISPHFLFNVFNNIDELIYVNRDKASKSLSNLSESLRYVLQDSSREFVPIENELEFVENYLNIASLSFSTKDFISFKKEGNCTGLVVAPMLLIPFIENAVKHCNRKAQPPGIEILVDCKPHRLTLFCRNHKKDMIADIIPDRQGFGLNNVMKRLELIYGDLHHLIVNDDNNLYTVELTISFR